jgi:hypothetical protein
VTVLGVCPMLPVLSPRSTALPRVTRPTDIKKAVGEGRKQTENLVPEGSLGPDRRGVVLGAQEVYDRLEVFQRPWRGSSVRLCTVASSSIGAG